MNKNSRKLETRLKRLIKELKNSKVGSPAETKKTLNRISQELKTIQKEVNETGETVSTTIEKGLDYALSTFLNKIVKPSIDFLGDNLGDLAIWVANHVGTLILSLL
jgi:enolase